ncbi:ribosome rescue GTPase HflX [Rickettsiella endosymbiont of Dermanyssus gallinae]|uniref:ribosome rescue GTPase HflX n=1 Tax=Rickettsiella endosymbiont of Dermanyssus gallinae TaxID=2856608 RepID=UPI001C52C5EC|nr:ribosome rescue GTPase HflX [Rickettsiella endosymbiont of Dermanyssus gallinae]
MFERPQSGELAILVHIHFEKTESKEIVEEFHELALAAGAKPMHLILGGQRTPFAKYFIGLGKVDEVHAALTAHQAKLVIFNHDLSPAQERNLEQQLQCRVVGRIGLILDIFAQRARTFEGKLQVKLAQLQHMSTRLIRGWTHLERQRGGIGLRGPGETQLESDKRLIRQQIKTIKKRLTKVQKQRAQSQRARRKSQLSHISLIGYTNTGKSTLFNALTGASVFAANQPFATLDPSIRRLRLYNGTHAILADTVGFIRQLPHDLIEAFSATLEETQEANLLIHVVDATSSDKLERNKEVQRVLEKIQAKQIPQLLVYNKIDLLTDTPPRLERDSMGLPSKVWVSASTGEGFTLLQQALYELLLAQQAPVSIQSFPLSTQEFGSC